jgi:hypothetical protein
VSLLFKETLAPAALMAQLVNLRRVGVPLRAAEGQGRSLPRSARGTSMPTYDEMSPTERKKLMNGLEALTGLQEGPKNALADGTRYEYDPLLKRTVEVTPAGERFAVTLVGGKLQRDSQKADGRKGGRLECDTTTN